MTPPNRLLQAALAVLVLLAVLAVACGPRRTASQAVAHDEYYPVGAFSLTERSGRAVTDRDLFGKVWVASFVFTRCTGPCPQVTGTMARLQGELAAHPDLRLVTFTVDPERDDPGELRRYADHFRADPGRWLFLTGPEKEIARLLREGFKVGRVKKEKAEPGDEFDHSTKLVVVDRNGNVRGYFDGSFRPEFETQEEFDANLGRLRAKVEELLQAPS